MTSRRAAISAVVLLWTANACAAADAGSRFLRVEFDAAAPRLTRIALDSLGGGGTRENLLGAPSADPTRPWASRRRDEGRTIEYATPAVRADAPASWALTGAERSLVIRSRFVTGAAADPLVVRFDPKVAHPTLLGRMPAVREVSLPCVLHVPDHGTMRITATAVGARLGYDARRFGSEPYVEVSFPAATPEQESIEYTLDVVSIRPEKLGADRDWLGRHYLNIFQLNPRLRVLANHAASDPVAFTVYKYADLAASPRVPPLAEGLTALDLVRATLDRYLEGMKGYGLVGYRRNMDGADTLEWSSTFDALDAYPSLLSAACTVAVAGEDLDWARRNWPALVGWAGRMLATDRDGNGLLEYGHSGNSGSWSGKGDVRPSNWWDQIGFGHEDAYANALAYRALTQLASLADALGEKADAARFAAAARKLRAAYLPAFYSKASGLLAGWRSADGELHDYAFTFVTSCAVCWDLVDRADAERLMATLLARMKAAGFTNYRLGLPGNLAPIRRADYVTLKKRWGGPEREDGSDAFGIFENGGATHCFAYFTVQALFKVGRAREARAILDPMLEAVAAGEFQGRCDNGRTREWKDWKGECWGYEGFLVDGYLLLRAAGEDAPADPEAVAVDREGNVYAAIPRAGTGMGIRKWDPAGHLVFDTSVRDSGPLAGGVACGLCTDEEYLYCAVSGWGREPWNHRQQIRRFRLKDGTAAPFTGKSEASPAEEHKDVEQRPRVGRRAAGTLLHGHIQLYEWPELLIPKNATEDERRLMRMPLRALDVAGSTLYVADALGGDVLTFDTETGAKKGAFGVHLPRALAVDPIGQVWVADDGGTVRAYRTDGYAGAGFGGLGEATGMAFGPGAKLYVADAKAGQVVTLNNTAEQAGNFTRVLGRNAKAGDRAAERFRDLRGVAVDARGNLVTIEREPGVGGARVARWSPGGALLWERDCDARAINAQPVRP